jgi:hypothetical protein
MYPDRVNIRSTGNMRVSMEHNKKTVAPAEALPLEVLDEVIFQLVDFFFADGKFSNGYAGLMDRLSPTRDERMPTREWLAFMHQTIRTRLG